MINNAQMTCSTAVQSAESATERMTAEGLKGVAFVEVHVVRDRDGAVANLDQIERILFSFTATPSS